MKILLKLCLIVCLISLEVGHSFSQTIQLGTGTATNGTTTSSPVNIWYRRTVAQFVYTAAELNAAGINGPCDLQDLGWFITQSPNYNIPGYTVKVKHVGANNVAAALGTTGWTTIKGPFTYNPTAGGWDMLGLDNTFTWNGTDNIGVEVCWSQVQPSYSSSGQCRIYSTASGYRYSWTDGAGNSCGATPFTTNTNKPQVQMTWGCVPPCSTPAPPTANNPSINCGDQATLTASGAPSNGDYIWYDDSNGTNQVGTGSSFTTPALSGNTTYYVSTFVPANCESSLIAVTVNVNSNVSNPSASNININCGDPASLTASGSTGNYIWFDDANGTNSIGTGNSISLGNLYADSTVYVGASAGSGGSTTIDYEDFESNNFGNWTQETSDDEDWSTNSGSTGSFNTGPSGPSGGTYYAYCETSYATYGDVFEIYQDVDLSGAGSAEITFDYHMYFAGATDGTLELIVDGTTEWSQVGQSQTSEADSWSQTTVPLNGYVGNSNVDIRFRFTSGNQSSSYQYDCSLDNIEISESSTGCLSNLIPVTADVNGPQDPTPNNVNVNCGDPATVAASGSTGNYEWFSDANGTNSIGTGNSLSLGNIYADSTVYVVASSGSNGTSTIYSEDWQSGNGGWTLGNSGPYWNRISGGTGSNSTGPNGGSNNGTPTNGNFYVYLETSTGAGTAYLTGPGFTINGNATLEFSYHMYGATMGTLGVEIFDGTNWTQVWSLSGQQQTSSAAGWTNVSIPLTGYSGAINVRFSGEKGSSFTGDMAIDDIEINETQTACNSNLVAVTAFVDPLNAPSLVANPSAICGNGSSSITASGAPTNGLYTWYSDPAGNNQIGTGPNYSTGNLTNSTTFYVQTSDGNSSGNAGSLNTTFAAGNGSNGNMFNINVLDDITITDFDVHQYAGQTGNFEVYYKSGTYNGSETNAAAWTLIGTANNIASNGQGNPTPLGLNLNLQLQTGAHAFYITSTNTNVYYTNGTNNNNIYAQNSEIEFFEGVGKGYPFGATFSPRIWNGIIHYETGSGQSACLSAIEPITVTVDQPATPPTISGGGTFCFGEQVTLTATGGSVPAGQFSWFENAVTNPSIGTGGSVTVSPNGTTDYIVEVPANGACAAASSNTITVTVPTPDNTLSVNNSQSTCTVNQNGYIHFLDPNGKLIASINSNGQNLGNVTATSYVEAAPLQVQDCASSILTSVLDRHWVITPQFQPTGPVEVVLPMEQNEEQSLVTNANSNSNPDDDLVGLTDIVLTKYAGPSNVDNDFQNNCFSQGGNETLDLFTQGMSGFVYDYWPSYTGNDLYASYDINSFSEFWLHGSSNLSPLPVSLTSFNANCQSDNFTEVTWETASEMNASHFIVERSRDGISWSNEHEVDAAGNANTLNSYSFEDHNAGIGFEGYYRLRQVDFNGEQTLYGPISVQCDEIKNAYMEVFPNPSSGNFTLRIFNNLEVEDAKIVILDVNGKVIHQQKTNINNGITTLLYDQKQLVKGMYYIRVIADGFDVAPKKMVVN